MASKIEFSHGTTNARGVMILITDNIPLKAQNTQTDDQGGLLIVDCEIDDSEFILVNLYAPISDKRLDQRSFGDHVCTQLEPYFGKSIVLAGDLNIISQTRWFLQ